MNCGLGSRAEPWTLVERWQLSTAGGNRSGACDGRADLVERGHISAANAFGIVHTDTRSHRFHVDSPLRFSCRPEFPPARFHNTPFYMAFKRVMDNKKTAKLAGFLFLLSVYNVLPQLLIILLQRQLLAWVLLSLIVVSSVIHISRNTIFGVALRYEFY